MSGGKPTNDSGGLERHEKNLQLAYRGGTTFNSYVIMAIFRLLILGTKATRLNQGLYASLYQLYPFLYFAIF